jgi:malonyl-CoA O-methyltransferase
VSNTYNTGTVASAFHLRADAYDHHVLVQKRVVENLAASVVTHLVREPAQILDVGTGTGALLERLHRVYHEAGLYGLDAALNMCQRARQKLGGECRIINGTAEQLPYRDGSFDLVVSASALQWVSDLPAALAEMRRVTKAGGMVCLAFFCEGTLCEMQRCIREAAGYCGRDGLRHVERLHSFTSVETFRAITEQLDFAQVVVSVETEVDWYDDLYSLLRAIKSIGAGAAAGGTGGLGWRGILKEAARRYQELYGQGGKIPASYEVLYAYARVP